MNGIARVSPRYRFAQLFVPIIAWAWILFVAQSSLFGQYDADGQPMAMGTDLYGSDPYSGASLVNSSNPDFEMPRKGAFDKQEILETRSVPAFSMANAKEFQPGRLLAVVGTEPILEGDIRPMVEPILFKNKDKIPEGQWDSTLQGLIRPALAEHISHKCLAQRFIKDMVGSKPVKEYAEAEKRINPRLSKGFYEKVIPKLMEDYDAKTEIELDQKLREGGTSLAAQRRLFRDSVLANEAINANVTKKPQIQLNQLRDYYTDHPQDWYREARVKWRELSVRFKNHPDKAAAYAKIAEMGNEIVFGGAPFDAVAKKRSEGVTADNGGQFDWTEKGSLKSKLIDKTIFEIPKGLLSDILEDDDGFHIVEVIEREEAKTQSMEEVQEEIKERLIRQQKTDEEKKFVEETKRQTKIWSVWPEDVPGARPLSEILPPQ